MWASTRMVAGEAGRGRSIDPDYTRSLRPADQNVKRWFEKTASRCLCAWRGLAWATMNKSLTWFQLFILLAVAATFAAAQDPRPSSSPSANVFPIGEGYVDAHGLMIYY